MPNLDLSGYLGQFLNNWVAFIAVRAFQVGACLLEYLFEESKAGDIAMLQLLHLSQVVVDLRLRKKHVVTVLADHLQDQNQVFEVSNVVDGQIQLGMSKVPDTVLQPLVACAAAEELCSDPETEVQGPVGDWIKRAVVQLEVADFCLGNLHDVAGGQHGEVEGFAEQGPSYILRGLLYESTHSGIIYYFNNIYFFYFNQRTGWVSCKQYEAPSIETDRMVTMAQVSRVRGDDQMMKRSYLNTSTTNSKQPYDNGTKKMGFQSSGIYLKPDNKVKQVESKISPADLKANLNQANIAFDQIQRIFLKTSNANQSNSTSVNIQAPNSSPIKRESILSQSFQDKNKKAAQLFTNFTSNQPQTAMFPNLMTPTPKIPARNPQSASTTAPSSLSPQSHPRNPHQDNITSKNPFVNACTVQTGQNGGDFRLNIGASVPKMQTKDVSVGMVGGNLCRNNQLGNNLGLVQKSSNLSFMLGENVLADGFTVQSTSNQAFQNPRQNTFSNQTPSRNTIINQEHIVDQSSQAPVSIQQQNLFQYSRQNLPSPQLNMKTNKSINTTQKPATKYAKIPTLTTNNNSNHISLDGYFSSLSAQSPSPTQNISSAIDQNIKANPQPNASQPATAPPTPAVPYLFDPNYYFQYVSDPIFQQQMELQMEKLNVEEFVAKSTVQLVQVSSQLQQMCNKCLGRLKERNQVGQINNIFYQLDRYTLKDNIVSRELDVLQSQQYEMEKQLNFLEKIFPENCLHSLSCELEDYQELEDLVQGLNDQFQKSPQFQSVLLLYQSLNAIEERVKNMDGKLDQLSGLQQQ